jgi:membrane-associated phospholipid phosphatase
MPAWQPATAAFFIYVGAVAVLMRGLDASKRRLALAGAAAGLAVAAGASVARHPLLQDWLIPPLALLIGYWTSGLLFVAPMPRIERSLQAIDRALEIRRTAAAVPTALAEILECSYAAVYLVIPIALAIHLVATNGADADRFWTVILVTDYVCFGMLPWIQTRPPRALEPEPPWRARFRAVNLRLLGTMSIQANTFPSGHAAEALAAALLVIGAGPLAVSALLVMAVAISAGAVLGRYHYATDAFAGWAVAAIVWLLA